MSALNTQSPQDREHFTSSRPLVTLELKVMNHPGVMLHIVGLFARRAFNLEGIACMPSRDGIHSRIWLRVHDDEKLSQIQLQLAKLVDVMEVDLHPPGHEAFRRMEAFFLA
ncbi:MAG: ACT domain-containing protein [Puniceicoccaceae bacterium]